jgi:ribosomal protein S18 acetylase RimI-like enzyme
MIKDSTNTDLLNIAKCHIDAFPDSFSSKLGLKYCVKMFDWYLSTDKAFLFHIEKDSKIVGYCGGIINDGTLSTGSSSAMMQHAFGVAITSLIKRPWLLFHNEILPNYSLIIKNILTKLNLKKTKKQKSNQINKKEPVIGLVVIGVNTLFQGKGYGSMLLSKFEQKAKSYNIHNISLTVKSSNKKAIKSYKLNGWEVSFRDKKTIRMTKKLSL